MKTRSKIGLLSMLVVLGGCHSGNDSGAASNDGGASREVEHAVDSDSSVKPEPAVEDQTQVVPHGEARGESQSSPAEKLAPSPAESDDVAEDDVADSVPKYRVISELPDGSREVAVEIVVSVPVQVQYEVQREDGSTEIRTETEYRQEARERILVVPAGADLEEYLREHVSDATESNPDLSTDRPGLHPETALLRTLEDGTRIVRLSYTPPSPVIDEDDSEIEDDSRSGTEVTPQPVGLAEDLLVGPDIDVSDAAENFNDRIDEIRFLRDRADFMIQVDRNEEAIALLDQVGTIAVPSIDELWLRFIATDNRNDYESSLRYIERLSEANPDDPKAKSALAWLLATCPDDARRDGPRALNLAEAACDATDFSNPNLLSTLAAAHAENGDFSKALEYVQRAISIVEAPVETEQIDSYLLGLNQAKPDRKMI